jgi:hypothetical protein
MVSKKVRSNKRADVEQSAAMEIRDELLYINQLTKEKAALLNSINKAEKNIKEMLNLCQEINELSSKLGVGTYIDEDIEITTKPKTILKYRGKEILAGFRTVKDNQVHVFVDRADAKLISPSLIKKVKSIRNRLNRELSTKQRESAKLSNMLQQERVVKDRKKIEKSLKDEIKHLKEEAEKMGL